MLVVRLSIHKEHIAVQHKTHRALPPFNHDHPLVPRTNRTVLAVSYWEKVTMGTRNLYSLLRFATEWDAEVTVPFLHNSNLNGFPSATGNLASFSLIFDINNVQQILSQHNMTNLVDYNLFISNLNKQKTKRIFFVSISFNEKVEKRRAVVPVYHKICQKNEKKNLKRLNRDINNSLPMNNITCCLIHGSIPVLPIDIAIGCGFNGLDEFTIIFRTWHGITQPDPKRKFRLFVPVEYTRDYTYPSAALPHSQYVIGNSTNRISQTVRGDDFIAVHIRTEKLFHKRHVKNDTKCLLDTIRLTEQVSQDHLNIKHVLYFADNTRFHYKHIFKEYNITITNANLLSSNGAFVAQIEQDMISHATILVISGGGSFQEAIVERYLKRNRFPKVYKVDGCMDTHVVHNN